MGNTITILGNKGSGKTYFSVKLLKKLENKDIIIIDAVNTYLSYVSKQGIQGFKKVVIDTPLIDFKVFFNKWFSIQKHLVKLIFDVSLLDSKDLVIFLDNLSNYLLTQKDLILIVDEIGDYVPQDRGAYSNGFERLVRIGRNYNIRVVMTTQRAQKVNKNVLALSDIYYIFKLIHNLDLNTIQKLIGYDNKEFKQYRKIIKNLEVGQYVETNGEHFKIYDKNDKEINNNIKANNTSNDTNNKDAVFNTKRKETIQKKTKKHRSRIEEIKKKLKI